MLTENDRYRNLFFIKSQLNAGEMAVEMVDRGSVKPTDVMWTLD